MDRALLVYSIWICVLFFGILAGGKLVVPKFANKEKDLDVLDLVHAACEALRFSQIEDSAEELMRLVRCKENSLAKLWIVFVSFRCKENI